MENFQKFRPVILLFLIMFLWSNNELVHASMTQRQREAFRTAKKVRIDVEQSYGEAKDVKLPFRDITRKLFEYAGLRVVESDDEEFDLKIEIKANGRAIGKDYKRIGGYATLYTQALVLGSVSFTIKGLPPFSYNFKGTSRVQPKKNILRIVSDDEYIRYRMRSSAPFVSTLTSSESFIPKIIALMGEIYGPDCLIAALMDGDIGVRRQVASQLGEIKDPRAIKPLVDLIKNEDEELRGNVITALGKIGDPGVIDHLLPRLQDDADRIKISTALALGNIKDPSVIGPLSRLLQNKDKWVRMTAATALGNIGVPQVVEYLCSALRDEFHYVRKRAAEALGEIKDTRAVLPLIEVLKDEQPGIAGTAAQALGKIEDPRAVDPLINALKVIRFPRQQKKIVDALIKITGKSLGSNWKSWRKWWKKNKRNFIKK